MKKILTIILLLVSIHVFSIEATISIVSLANPVCQGSNTTFSAYIENGGTAPVYQWKKNGTNVGSNVASYTYAPENNDVITCVLTSSDPLVTNSPVTSNAVTMTVVSLKPVSISIVTTTNPSCSGNTVQYTATPTNSGNTPSYQWKVNNINVGAGGYVFSYNPVNGDIVKCILTSSVNCATGNPATSNEITQIVNEEFPVEITITASNDTVCNGSNITFTANVINGGTSPLYQWQVNGFNIEGATNSTYTFAPNSNDYITCEVTSNKDCAIDNPKLSENYYPTISTPSLVSVNILTASTSVCSGTSVICTASPENGGDFPTYQWKKNGVNVGTNSSTYTFIPLDGDKVFCIMTSSISCPIGSPATSGILTFHIFSNVVPSVSITPSPNDSVCASTLITLTAVSVNGGTSPTYQWKKNGNNILAATNSTYQFIPDENDSVRVMMTSSLSCVTENNVSSNKVTFSILSCLLASISIYPSAYTVTSGTSVTYTSTITNGGVSPTYQWYEDENIISGATNSTLVFIPSDTTDITCSLTSSDPLVTNNSAISNVVNIIVYSTGTPCSGIPTVVHDGKTYNTVQIGTQCWLRENMNIGTRINNSITQTNNATIECYCYNNDTVNCNIYGGLYQWAEAVQYYNGVTNTTHWSTPVPTVVQGICPSGWHIPTKTEWDALVTYLGGTAVAGGKVKSTLTASTTDTIGWYRMPTTMATNTSGLSMLPSGGNGILFGFTNKNAYTNIWTVTKGSLADAAYMFGAAYNYTNTLSGQLLKVNAASVRCIKN